jgi:hypothetical protein
MKIPIVLSTILVLLATDICAKGLGVVKAQSYHDDATANVFVFESVSTTSAIVTFNIKGQKPYSVAHSDKVAYVDLIDRIGDITRDSDISPYRKSVQECKAFAGNYIKSKALLTPYIEMISEVVEKYDAGMVKKDGEWIEKKGYTAMVLRNQNRARNESISNKTSKIASLKSEVSKIEKEIQLEVKRIRASYVNIAHQLATEPADSMKKDDVTATNVTDPETKNVKGQIFIVRNDAHNVKIGGVKVFLLDPSTFNEILRDASDLFYKASSVGIYDSNIKNAVSHLKSMKDKYKSYPTTHGVICDVEQNVFKARNLLNSPRTDLLSRRWRSHVSARSNYYGTDFYLENTGDGATIIDAFQWFLSYSFERAVDDARHAELTDADGKFSLQIPTRQPSVVLAKASRRVGGSDDRYFWIVELSANHNGDVLLQNNNLLDADRLINVMSSFYTSRNEREQLATQKKLGLPRILSALEFTEFQKSIKNLGSLDSRMKERKMVLDSIERKLDNLQNDSE